MSSGSRPVAPRTRALHANSGSQVSALLAPLKPKPGAGGAAQPNHALANRQALKAAQIKNAMRREEEEAKAAEAPFKMARFKSVESVLRQKSNDGTLGMGAPRMEATAAAAAASATRRGVSSGGGAPRRGTSELTAKMGGMSITYNGGTGAPRAASRGGIAPLQRPGQQQQQQYHEEHYPQHQYSDGDGGFDDDFDDGHFDGEGESEEQQQQGFSRGRTQQFDEEAEEEDLHGLMGGNGARGGGGGYGGYGGGAPSRDPYSRTASRGGAGGVGGIDSIRVPASLQNGRADPQSAGGKSFITENARRVIASSKQLASARGGAGGGEETGRSGGMGSTGQLGASIAAGGTGGGHAALAKHDNYGRVPQYIKDQKAAAAAAQKAKEDAQKEKDLGIPPGMILMPEEQRLQTLAVLHENHAKILQDIAAFPLRVETMSRKKAKAELEAKLEEVEAAMQLFSRKRVLIQP